MRRLRHLKDSPPIAEDPDHLQPALRARWNRTESRKPSVLSTLDEPVWWLLMLGFSKCDSGALRTLQAGEGYRRGEYDIICTLHTLLYWDSKLSTSTV